MATCRTSDCCNPTDAYHSDQDGAAVSNNCRVVQILTTEADEGEVDSPYSFTFSAFGGVGPYTWVLLSGELPDGLLLSSSGTISGTPTEDGSFDVVVKVIDENGEFCSTSLTLTIAEASTLFLHSYWTYEEATGTRLDSYGSNDLAVQLGVPSNDVGIIGNCLKFSTASSMRVGNAAVDIIDFTTAGATLVGAYNRSAASPLTIWQNVVSDVLNVSLIGFSVTASGGNIVFNLFNWITLASQTITLPSASLSTWGFYRAWVGADQFMHLQLDNGAISDADATGLFPLGGTPHHGNLIVTKGTANYIALLDETAFFDGVLTDDDYNYIYNSGAWRTLGPGYPGT